jgi:hypothetical protein
MHLGWPASPSSAAVSEGHDVVSVIIQEATGASPLDPNHANRYHVRNVVRIVKKTTARALQFGKVGR